MILPVLIKEKNEVFKNEKEFKFWNWQINTRTANKVNTRLL